MESVLHDCNASETHSPRSSELSAWQGCREVSARKRAEEDEEEGGGGGESRLKREGWWEDEEGAADDEAAAACACVSVSDVLRDRPPPSCQRAAAWLPTHAARHGARTKTHHLVHFTQSTCVFLKPFTNLVVLFQTHAVGVSPLWSKGNNYCGRTVRSDRQATTWALTMQARKRPVGSCRLAWILKVVSENSFESFEARLFTSNSANKAEACCCLNNSC